MNKCDWNDKICPLALMAGGSMLACVKDGCPFYQPGVGMRDYMVCKLAEVLNLQAQQLYHQKDELEVRITDMPDLPVTIAVDGYVPLEGLVSIRTKEE